MKRIGIFLIVLVVILNSYGGLVWAAESLDDTTPPTTATDTTSTSGDDEHSGILDTILTGVKEVKTSVTSVVDFFQNFDPGELINNWIKESLSDFISPTLAWAEQNTAQYPYITRADPQFIWWQILVVLSLALILYAMMRIAGQIIKGQRTAGDIIVLFGLMVWLFSTIWATNLMVYARNHITYTFLHWMVQENWLSPDTVRSTAQFIVPDLAKAIMANQGAVSAILAFILGGMIMLAFELVQMMVYAVWVLLVVGSPIFVTMTALGANFTPFLSYLNGLTRTLIVTIVIALSWGVQGYVYASQTDTTLQIIYQAVVVIITIIVLWMFWGKFILTEILGMLSQPIQTVKGNVTSSAGSSLQTTGKAASILGALTGNPRLAAMGYKAKTAGDVLSGHGEEIKVQASRGSLRHNDAFSRMIEKSLGGKHAATGEGSLSEVKGFKTTFKGPSTRPPSINKDSSSYSLDAHLDKVEQQMIPEEVECCFTPVSTQGGGTFFKYSGPMVDELEDQLRNKGVTVHTVDNQLAVDIVDEKIAKYFVTKNFRNLKPYWEDNEEFVTVDPYGITHYQSHPPENGLNMGTWRAKRKQSRSSDDANKEESLT